MQNVSERLAKNPATLLKMNSFTGIFKDSIFALTHVQCVPSCFGCTYVCTYNTLVSTIYITISLTKFLLLLL